MNRIYIQIPAYRDIELEPTILDLLEKAAFPDRLRIAICWQKAPKEKLSSFITTHPQIEIIEISYKKSNGCNWARSILQKKWEGEPYTLFLDSHHRFIQDWDKHLISMYESLRSQGVEKPILTAYLPPYSPSNDPQGRQQDPMYINCHSRERGMLIYLVAYKIPMWQRLRNPIEAKFISLHFIFTAGAFNREIPFDDEIYFFGDEVVTALRAYTHGYQLFHPHYVVGWHLYRRDETRQTHWQDHPDHQQRHERSHRRIRDIFLGIDHEALGKIKTIEDYEFYIFDKLITSA